MFRKNIEKDFDLPRRTQRLCGEKSGFPCGAQNSGIVLIIVLGMLTVMVLLAVSFAVSMRTERLAAGNAADTVRARQLIHVGLARAMNDLANNLGTNGLYSTISGVHVGKAYPDWSVTNSAFTNVSGSGAARFPTNVYLVRGEATNYVPRALWTDATNADNLSPSNHWLPVESLHYDGGVLVESNLMGRVAYLILNCSGLLDANYAGGAAARLYGTNPNEIVIGYLGETKAIFPFQRSTPDIRYETMGELNAVAAINKPATNLFVYSRALPGYWDRGYSCAATQVNLSGSAAQLVLRREHITNALANAGFTTYESCALYSNLIDYVDGDSIPSNFEYGVESVPMINEVVVSNNVTVAPSGSSTAGNKNYTIRPMVYVECSYPFVSGSGSFDLNGSVTFSAPNIFSAPGTITVPFNNVALGTFSPGGFPFKSCFILPSYGPYDVPQVPTVRLISSITLSVTSNNVPVDKITIPITLTNEHDGATGANNPSYASAECRDPRFNADPNDANYCRKQTGATSLGIINTWPGSLFPADSDGDDKMFVANQPLHSVAELGYLVYTNAPWKTVKLYGPNRHRVLDVFGLSTNVTDVLITNSLYRGLVNCNSNFASNATAVIFAGMKTDQYPDGPPISNNLSMAAAQSLAASIFSGGQYTNLSDVGRSLNPPPGATELEKESYFRNAFNLINLRQNVFTVIIEAQAASSGNIPKNPAKQRAVAIVWRDPFTGEMFVRHIRWLGD